jgi:hypothetical protein
MDDLEKQEQDLEQIPGPMPVSIVYGVQGANPVFEGVESELPEMGKGIDEPAFSVPAIENLESPNPKEFHNPPPTPVFSPQPDENTFETAICFNGVLRWVTINGTIGPEV